jgi:hypothetical protein
MTSKEFLKRVSGSRKDVLGELFRFLVGREIRFCVIGDLAVSAYAEPVVGLDLDIGPPGSQVEAGASES